MAKTRYAVARSVPVLAAFLIHTQPAAPQEARGGGVSTVGGALLGLYSAAALVGVGSLFPCDRTTIGPKCSAVSAVVGGAAGLVSGGLIGREDPEAIGDRGRGALYGLAIGGFVGGLLQESVRQYAWDDAVLVAAFGAAVGAAPRGALVGTGVGAGAGGLAWALSPRGGLQDVVLFTVVGGAVGGLYDWVSGAVDARESGGPRLAMALSFTVG